MAAHHLTLDVEAACAVFRRYAEAVRAGQFIVANVHRLALLDFGVEFAPLWQPGKSLAARQAREAEAAVRGQV